jgi:putative ABC transport system substrate-binding protein
MRRREFITLIGGAVAALPRMALGQQQSSIRRIGVLSQGSIHNHPTPEFREFLERLRELGWTENQNLLIEWRFSEGSAVPLAQRAAELVEKDVEVIVTTPTQPTIAAKQATSTIPIIFLQVADPLVSGIVANLARPDANVTGLSTLAPDIAGKRLALLKEALPTLKRVSVLWNRPSKGAALVLEEITAAGRSLNIELQDIGVSEATEFDRAFDAAVSNKSAAVVVIDDPVMLGQVEAVTRIAAARKLPIASQFSQYTVGGSLMAYGPNLQSLFRRGAEYVDRILRGSKPANLPVEQPDKFTFVLNLKTAKALSIEISPELLARADEVIE